GEPPFKRADLPGLMYEHMTVNPIPPAEKCHEIPAPINQAILKALAKAPADRFQTADEFLAALDLFAGFDSGVAQLPGIIGDHKPVSEEVIATQPVPIVQPQPVADFAVEPGSQHLPAAPRQVATVSVGSASAVSASGAVAVAGSRLAIPPVPEIPDRSERMFSTASVSALESVSEQGSVRASITGKASAVSTGNADLKPIAPRVGMALYIAGLLIYIWFVIVAFGDQYF
ncbi:MAG: hypothetical protein ACD_39C00750G0001, partial [uncultured bacterium]